MLRLYLVCYTQDSAVPLDDKRLWEFQYKLQHEEPRVKVVNSDDNSLLVSWNKDYVEEEERSTNDLIS